MRKALRILGNILGVFFALCSTESLLKQPQAYLFGTMMLCFGLWLISPIRNYVINKFPSQFQSKLLIHLIGFIFFIFMFGSTPKTVHTSQPSTESQQNPHTTTASNSPLQARNTEAVSAPNSISSRTIKEVPTLPITTKIEQPRQQEPVPSNVSGTTKVEANDCSLIAKFSYNAAQAYALGMTKKEFIPIAWGGFIAGHKEVLENRQYASALYQLLDMIYEDASNAGRAMHIGGKLKSRNEPTEYIRKKIVEIAQFELGICIGKDSRSEKTKSEFCVDSVLQAISSGRLSFEAASSEFGKCGNGYD